MSWYLPAYLGDDYPRYYPMEPLNNVFLTPEDTLHYPLTGPTAAAQWASNNPPGGGYVRLGEPKRYLCVSMFHQLHCLRYLRQALVTADDPFATISHGQHCLNYLRQAILCQPDLTLEDPTWRDSGWWPGKLGATHTCRDWGQVYEEMEKNFGQ
ncbi:hypothetical protein K439DRAFT_1375421 [Ramaria rubella]|nr:hypothetical protein K439DRAFT_1375421 [Ramaria rubella]